MLLTYSVRAAACPCPLYSGSVHMAYDTYTGRLSALPSGPSDASFAGPPSASPDASRKTPHLKQVSAEIVLPASLQMT